MQLGESTAKTIVKPTVKSSKGIDLTSRRMINILVALQISLGSLYVAITTLALVTLRGDESMRNSVPDQISLFNNFLEGIVMIINGYLTQLAVERGYLFLLIVTILINFGLVSFNCYELIDRFINVPKDFDQEINGVILMTFLESVYYFCIVHHSVKLYSTIKLRQERLLQSETKSDSTKHEDVFKFPTTIDSIPINDSIIGGRIRVSRQINQFKFTAASDPVSGPKVVRINYDSDESQE
ncbi:uncharacterized protein LOC128397723 [Panonychus citri]|uniref:uncharacterized protein LOC128397723 n=1 Tax=Panonychus citri TaxID=50023 RepID=UPI0023081A56|nr:uncharacterized protein LOC128397723 [Panonychus citri]